MLTPGLAKPFPLEWGFSTRTDPDAAMPPVRLLQVHGRDLVEAVDPVPADLPRADGIWTRAAGRTIGVRVADCVPVLLAGPLPGSAADTGPGGPAWAAALHAGWRGTVAGILRQCVAVYAGLGGRPRELAWVLGPAILRCHFEVGEEVVAAARLDPAWREELAVPGPGGRPHLDLHGLLRAQALDLGLDPARGEAIPACTYCSPDRLHSYRRGDRHGRQWGWIRIGAGA